MLVNQVGNMTDLEYYRQELETLSDELKARIDNKDYEGAYEIMCYISDLESRCVPHDEENLVLGA